MMIDLAKAWVTSLLLGVAVAIAVGVGALLFSVFRFLAESGPDGGVPPCPEWHDIQNGVCWHQGWGYGPVALGFVLVAWTVTALVIVAWDTAGRDIRQCG